MGDDCDVIRRVFLMFFDLVCPRDNCRIKYSLECIWKFEDGTGYGPEECRPDQNSGRSVDHRKSPSRPCTGEDQEETCQNGQSCDVDRSDEDNGQQPSGGRDGDSIWDLFHFDFDRYRRNESSADGTSCLWGWMSPRCYATDTDDSEQSDEEDDRSGVLPWPTFGRTGFGWGTSPPFFGKDKDDHSDDTDNDDDLTCRWFNRTNECILKSTKECSRVWVDWINKAFQKTKQSVLDLCKDPCLPNPCLNGGSCQPNERDNYVCHCVKGWQGEKCEERTCKVAEAKLCIYNFVSKLITTSSANGIELDSVCGTVNETLRCIDINIVHCSSDEQLYFKGFKEIILNKVETVCLEQPPKCSSESKTLLSECIGNSGLKKVLDESAGIKSLCWANIQCFLTIEADCWQIALIKDILIFSCDIKNIQCDIRQSLHCISSYAAEVEWQLGDDLPSSIINDGLLPPLDKDHLPSIPGIGYDFCLSANMSVSCVYNHTVGCTSSWGDFLSRKLTNITKSASVSTFCKDPCAKHPCKHGYCESDGFAPRCYCNPGYTGQFCEDEINRCDIESFRMCIGNVSVVIEKSNHVTCRNIEASLQCLGIHSLTCDNFFGEANMASYVYLWSKAKLQRCNVTKPKFPLVELDLCVANATITCTKTAVTTFINETTHLTYDDGHSIIEHEFTSSCRYFKTALLCVNNISVTCVNSNDAILRTVKMTESSLSVGIDLQCSSCEAVKAEDCITLMDVAIINGSFCNIDNYTDVLFSTKPDTLPSCSDICSFIDVTEVCVTRSLTSCQNTTKTSIMAKWRSVKSKLSDQCLSVCWPNPCLVGGTCNVINNTDYFCTCPSDRRLGQRCEIASDCMFDFGPSYGDKEIYSDLEKKVDIGRGIQLYDDVYSSFYISVNGYISFSGKPKFTSFLTFPTSGMTLLAPFFAGQDLSCGGRIFYQVYRRSSKNNDHETSLLDKASDDVKEAIANQNDHFKAQVVIVITWYNVVGIPYNKYSKSNTYQLRIVSSKFKSFVFYSYHRMSGESKRAFVGWATESGTSMVTELTGDKLKDYEQVKQNNESIPGCWFWSFLPVIKPPEPQPADKCLSWIESTIDLTQYKLPSCPCNYRLITSDQRFRHTTPKGGQYCANSTRIYKATYSGKTYEYQQVCSYSRDGYLQTSRPFGASATVVNQVEGPSDKEAFDFCCRMSTRHCDDFFSVRPISNCFSYRSPLIALLWGDPHIITIDRHMYTFNGIGDYVLMRIGEENDPEFDFQGRMEPVRSGNATIYTGFAIRVRGGMKYVIVFDRQTNGLKLIVNDEVKPTMAKNSYKYNVNWEDRSSLMIDFSSFSDIGFESLIVQARADMLSMIPQFNYKLLRRRPLGLMGITTNNVFQSANGRRIPTTDPDCIIFSQFGQTWRLSGPSLFPDQLSGEGRGWCGHPCDHNTRFTEDELRMSCGDSQTCRFDACATGDLTIASVTREIESDFKNKTDIFENTPPEIFGDRRILAKVGEEVRFTLTVIDKDRDSWVVFTADGYNANNAIFDNKTVTFVWTPTDTRPVDISFVAVDSRGSYSSVFQVELILCSGCSGHGQCNYDIVSGLKDQPNFKMAECECDSGWQGEQCAYDEDGCLHGPCGFGGLCRDVPANDVNLKGGYVCISCGAGLVLKDSQCIVEIPVVPERAVTEIKNNKIGLVLYLDNLPWTDDYLNIETPKSVFLINFLEPILNELYGQIATHFHTTIRRFYRGSLAVEHQIQLTELSYETILDIARQLKQLTAGGVVINGVRYPVKAMHIIAGDGNEVEINNDCQFYDALDLCQNGGFCVMRDLNPECKCLSDTANAFCEEATSSTDLKLIISLSVMSVLFLLGIVIIAVWAARKAKMNKMPPAYQPEKDTTKLDADISPSQSDLSLGKQHAPRYHSWWPGHQPEVGSHA